MGADSQHPPVQHLPRVVAVAVASDSRRVPALGSSRVAKTEHLRIHDCSCDCQHRLPSHAHSLVRPWLTLDIQKSCQRILLLLIISYVYIEDCFIVDNALSNQRKGNCHICEYMEFHREYGKGNS